MLGERQADRVFAAIASRRGRVGATACAVFALALLGGQIAAGAQETSSEIPADQSPSVEPQPAEPQPAETPLAETPPAKVMLAILQGLDKTTARVSTIEAPIGGIARFGTLEIIARACKKKPPTEPPESAAFLEITDVRPDSPAVRIFSGWMFASSPALSALEHPVYDVWVIDCRMGPSPDAASPPSDVAPESPPESPGASE